MSGVSTACRRFVLTVGIAGLVPFTWAMWTLIATPPHPFWFLLAGLALLGGLLSIRIPSMRATISVSEGFIFTAALLFGPAAATVVAILDGLVVSLWSRKRSALKVLFGIGEAAVSVSLASLLFYALADVRPLYASPTPLTTLVGPLLALTATYFALNTLLAGTAVWLDSNLAPRDILRQHLPHVALHASATLLLSVALVQTSGNLALAAVAVLIPMLLASHLSSYFVAGRLEDTNRHLAELQRLYNATVETLAMAIDAKDQVTHGHIRRVQMLSGKLATALGADARELRAIEAAALLHDLGKLAVPEHILNKPGALTPSEYDEMKKHAEIGAAILASVDFPFPVVPIVRHHHENWDGSGYPDGLKGPDIPLGARILSVVDCYDALTSDRPYRRRMSHEDAMGIIQSRSGRTYDPDVVAAFLQLPVSQLATEESAATKISPMPMRAPISTIRRPASAAAAHARKERDAQLAKMMRMLDQASSDQVGIAVESFIPLVIHDAVGVFYRYDEDKNLLTVAGLHGGFDGRLPETMALGHGISGWVAANRQKVFNADAELDLGDGAGLIRPPLRMCVSLPVVTAEGHLRGALTVYSPYAFSESERLLIESVAERLAAPVLEAPLAALGATA